MTLSMYLYATCIYRAGFDIFNSTWQVLVQLRKKWCATCWAKQVVPILPGILELTGPLQTWWMSIKMNKIVTLVNLRGIACWTYIMFYVSVEEALVCVDWPEPEILQGLCGGGGEWDARCILEGLCSPSATYSLVFLFAQAADLDGEIDLSTCYDVTEFPVQRNYGFLIHVRHYLLLFCLHIVISYRPIRSRYSISWLFWPCWYCPW